MPEMLLISSHIVPISWTVTLLDWLLLALHVVSVIVFIGVAASKLLRHAIRMLAGKVSEEIDAWRDGTGGDGSSTQP